MLFYFEAKQAKETPLFLLRNTMNFVTVSISFVSTKNERSLPDKGDVPEIIDFSIVDK
jgi:hypothetical protein